MFVCYTKSAGLFGAQGVHGLAHVVMITVGLRFLMPSKFPLEFFPPPGPQPGGGKMSLPRL